MDTLCQLCHWGVGGGIGIAPVPPSWLESDTPSAVTPGKAMFAPTHLKCVTGPQCPHRTQLCSSHFLVVSHNP